jgi:hypothetical protein
MLRLLGFAMLLLVAVCLVLGASIALADDGALRTVASMEPTAP